MENNYCMQDNFRLVSSAMTHNNEVGIDDTPIVLNARPRATEIEAHTCFGETVAVVGGGNSAGQACLFLADHAARVHLLVRGESLDESMSRYLSDRIARHPNVAVRYHCEVRDVIADPDLGDVRADCSHDPRDLLTQHRGCRHDVVRGEQEVRVTEA